MSILSRLLGGVAAAELSSAEIRAAIQNAKKEVRASDKARDACVGQRARILVTGTDDDLRKHDQKATDIKLRYERLAAAVLHLETELERAAVRESGRALEVLASEAQEATARYERNLNTVAGLNVELVPLLAALAADYDLIQSLSSRIKGEGKGMGKRIVFLDRETRYSNRPVHQLAVVPEVFEGQGWYRPPGSSIEVRFVTPPKVYDGPIHELPEKPYLANEHGDPIHRLGR